MEKIIILDTNIIYSDFWMGGIFFKLFISLTDLNYYWYFPQIIIDESIGKLREKIIDEIKNLALQETVWKTDKMTILKI
ncbi:MAG: hypothetical protein EPN93_19520 [Spirochaetes bacterium]|nr:MAG: hypothetical protein EPN93_19520 [Spirochaetota bacterium]